MSFVLSAAVAERLGYYVYIYVDPRDSSVFYVGKGCKRRVLSHLSASGESEKVRRIAELRAVGLRPRIEILAHQLLDEETALRIEAAVIDLLCLGTLTNQVRGWRSVELGRIPLEELQTYYDAPPCDIREATLLIRINQRYRHGMPAQELYEATRGIWRLGERCHQARFAMAVFEGVVREVYRINSWHPAGTTRYETRTRKDVASPNRVEFIGAVASGAMRSRYVGKSVAARFPRGLQSPVIYVNC